MFRKCLLATAVAVALCAGLSAEPAQAQVAAVRVNALYGPRAAVYRRPYALRRVSTSVLCSAVLRPFRAGLSTVLVGFQSSTENQSESRGPQSLDGASTT